MRDPGDEIGRLVITPPDVLARINHHCFRGRQAFGRSFRALVAGGGTGDATIFLADQLRAIGSEAEVTHLDMSAASNEIARKRAAVRGLKNIKWVHASLLDIPKLKLGEFDYINCVGVVHHLESPEEGLRCLTSVLAKQGAIALMVYGRYGRMGVTVVQDMLKMILADETSWERKVDTANALLKSLPSSNAYMIGRARDAVLKAFIEDPVSLADTFLHPRDRPFNVQELYAMVEKCGLQLATFTTFDGKIARIQYDSVLMAQDDALKQRISSLPLSMRQLLAEMMDGRLHLHTAYLTRQTETIAADLADDSNVPFVPSTSADCAIALLREAGAAGLDIELSNGNLFHIRPSPLALAFLRDMDGHRTFGEIVSGLGLAADALPLIVKDLTLLRDLDWLLLRHRSIKPFPVVGPRYAVNLRDLGSMPWRIKYFA